MNAYKDRMAELTEQLEKGLREVFSSERYRAYLQTMSRFHGYSLNNTLLIHLQCPGATLIAGYRAWQTRFHRQVRQGEKGIRIIAPCPYKDRIRREKTHPLTGEVLLDGAGRPVTETVEVTRAGFRPVLVWDVSQTEGMELPTLEIRELRGGVPDYGELMDVLRAVSPVPMEMRALGGGAKGCFDPNTGTVYLQEGMSQVQTVKTAIHELTHALLHNDGARPDTATARRREVEAESVAYVVCRHCGIDTSEYSFTYIAGWSGTKDTEDLRASLETVRKASGEIIGRIEGERERLAAERRDPERIAAAVDDLIYASDPSLYGKVYPTRDEGRADLRALLTAGETGPMEAWLRGIAGEGGRGDLSARASELLERVRPFRRPPERDAGKEADR